MRLAWVFAVIAGVFAAGCVHADPPNPREDVLAVSRAFDDAQRTQNLEAIDSFLAPDFRVIYSSGRVADRADFIAGYSPDALTITELRAEEPFYVDLGADAAVVGGIGIIRGAEGGAAFEQRFHFADTLVRRDGRWYAVYIQVTPLPAQN